MTEDELFALLRRAFGLDSVLKKYRALEPLEALTESAGYWDWAKGVQDGCRTNSVWWEYENHKTLAYVLMGVYCWRLLEHDEFPSLPDAGPDVMADSHALLCLWSRSLILDHVHKWVNCRHDGAGLPSHPKCAAAAQGEPGGLYHQICDVCGEERFDPQPMLDRAYRMLEQRGISL